MANESTNPLTTPQALDPSPKRRLDRGMKAILLSLFVALLMVGCGGDSVLAEKEEKINSTPQKAIKSKEGITLKVCLKRVMPKLTTSLVINTTTGKEYHGTM